MTIGLANGHDAVVRLLEEFELRSSETLASDSLYIDHQVLGANADEDESDSDGSQPFFDAEDW